MIQIAISQAAHDVIAATLVGFEREPDDSGGRGRNTLAIQSVSQ
jgi:hypothetical protein